MIELQRVISGGQTGIDQLGLEVARSLGIPTGGMAPKGYLTENGPDERLRDVYNLTEHPSASYPPRTNVQQSDGTVLLGLIAGGTKLTLDSCEKEGKPYLVNPTAEAFRTWLIDYKIKVLNVAGSRGSNLNHGQLQTYRKLLYDVLMTNQRLSVLFSTPPVQWGLRGDPYLWNELAEVAKTLLLPATETELTDLLHSLIRNLLGHELVPGKMIAVPRFAYGGMSSGMVGSDFWLNTAIPLLKQRFIDLSSL
ncbi:hypothetical protein GCM10028819_09270 [Spirosoma humi]